MIFGLYFERSTQEPKSPLHESSDDDLSILNDPVDPMENDGDDIQVVYPNPEQKSVSQVRLICFDQDEIR